MTDRSEKNWNKAFTAVIGSILALAVAIGGYWINRIDHRNAIQDAQLADHSYRIRGNEKDIEYAVKRFEEIDEKMSRIDKKLDVLIQETRNQ